MVIYGPAAAKIGALQRVPTIPSCEFGVELGLALGNGLGDGVGGTTGLTMAPGFAIAVGLAVGVAVGVTGEFVPTALTAGFTGMEFPEPVDEELQAVNNDITAASWVIRNTYFFDKRMFAIFLKVHTNRLP